MVGDDFPNQSSPQTCGGHHARPAVPRWVSEPALRSREASTGHPVRKLALRFRRGASRSAFLREAMPRLPFLLGQAWSSSAAN